MVFGIVLKLIVLNGFVVFGIVNYAFLKNLQ